MGAMLARVKMVVRVSPLLRIHVISVIVPALTLDPHVSREFISVPRFLAKTAALVSRTPTRADIRVCAHPVLPDLIVG